MLGQVFSLVPYMMQTNANAVENHLKTFLAKPTSSVILGHILKVSRLRCNHESAAHLQAGGMSVTMLLMAAALHFYLKQLATDMENLNLWCNNTCQIQQMLKLEGLE